MEKIIGRGVLLLSSGGQDLKFGYQLSSAGILFSALGGGAALQTLSQAFPGSPASVQGTGHVILNALPASPNDAFYDVTFRASDIGATSESFSLQVKESGPFAHGPRSHFSNLDLTFEYSQTGGLSIVSGGKVHLHLHDGVFDGEKEIELAPEWDKDRETLVFKANAANIQMDAIGKLSKIEVEVGSSYDRWAHLQGLYTFDGGLPGSAGTETAAHDISGKEAPSLYFTGVKDANIPSNYGASWTARGIAFGGGLLASQQSAPNPVIDSILETGDFSVELWMHPAHPALSVEDNWLFAFQGKREGQEGKNPYNFFFGQGPWQSENSGPGTHLNAKFNFPETGVPDLNGRRWESPLSSPAHSLSDELMHVVYSCSREGLQRIFINGVEVAQRSDPGYDNRWEGGLRIAVGANLPGGPGNINPSKPWKGEVHQLAIFNRALTAEDVNLHYRPAIRITGDFSLDNMIAPLKDEAFPFHLQIGEEAAALTASQAVNLNIKPQLGFRQVYLECNKSQDSPSWAFSGRFTTRFWEDLFGLDAHISQPGNLLELTSPAEQSHPIHIPELGIAKYKDILLRIGVGQAWELSFGEHQEYGLISMVVENAIADYGYFRMGGAHLVLADPIQLDGKWLNEDMAFVSQMVGASPVLKDSTTFSIPFTIELPPQTDPETGDAWGDPILLADVPMTISIDVALHKEGFLGVVNASFNYKNQVLNLPERRIYEAPSSKMALLGDLLEELKAQANTLFAQFRKHSEDYYLDMNTNNLLSYIDNDTPYIHLHSSSAVETTIVSTLPRIFTADPPSDYLSPAPNPVFTLSQDAAACTLTIDLNGASPASIRSAFDGLMAQVEGQHGLSPGGLRLLQSRIAERLPLAYDDLLYYHYGWDVGKNYIDLHPGMRLRVDFQNYQFVHVTEQKAKSGFVGGGSILIPIHTYTHDDDDGSQYLGFGPFLSRLRTDSRGDISTDGVGGLIDLAKAGSRKPFFRLFFPNEAIPATAPERSATIVGASRWQDLPTEIPVPADNSGNSASFFFRDKATAIPEIQVFIGNRGVYVPVGTTLRQLVEEHANVPMPSGSQQPNLAAFLGRGRPRRLIHTGQDSTPAYRFLNLGAASAKNNRDIFDLPLVKGDRFYF